MNVATATRGRMRLSTGPTFHSTFEAGPLRVEDIQANPNPVQSGDAVTIALAVQETIEFVGPLDPDNCNPPDNYQTQGIQARVTVNPEWAAAQDTLICVPVQYLSGGRRDVQFEFQAPRIAEGSQADLSYEVTVETTGSNQSGTTTEVLTVANDGSGRGGCTTDSECGQGYECRRGECVPTGNTPGGGGPWLPCVVDPGRDCEAYELASWGVVGIMLLFGLATLAT